MGTGATLFLRWGVQTNQCSKGKFWRAFFSKYYRRTHETHQNSKTQIIQFDSSAMFVICITTLYQSESAHNNNWFIIVTENRKNRMRWYIPCEIKSTNLSDVCNQTSPIDSRIRVSIIQSSSVWVGSPFGVINKCTRIMQFSSKTTSDLNKVLCLRLIITGSC